MPTPEEIKKIAREYAEYRAEPFDDAHDEIALEYFKDTIAFLEWLSKDFVIVPKSNVNALQGEIFKEIMDAHDADDWQSAAHYILDVMPRSFNGLFGKDMFEDLIRKE